MKLFGVNSFLWVVAVGLTLTIPGIVQATEAVDNKEGTTAAESDKTSLSETELLKQQLEAAGWSVEQESDGSLSFHFPQPVSEGEGEQGDGSAVIPQAETEQLKQQLEAAGWSVEQESDGSLSFQFPQPVSEGEGEQDDGSAVIPLKDTERLKQQLEAAGWDVEQESDGSLRFQLPEQANQQPATPPGQEESTDLTPQKNKPDFNMQFSEQLWRAQRAPNGSIWFYPVSPGTAAKVKEDDAVIQNRLCEGEIVANDIELPVDEWTKVRTIAEKWLKESGEEGVKVGKIREIFRIYLVSIVEGEEPFALQHQIAIRKSDGRVIVLN